MLNTVYMLLIGLAFLVGSLANSLSLRYFLSKPRSIPNLLYSSIAANDLALSLLILPITLSFYSGAGRWFSSRGVCNVWGMAWDICNHMSVYLVMVFNLSRTTFLLYPFSRRSRGIIKSVLVGYVIYLFLQSAAPYFFDDAGYSYDPDLRICRWQYIRQFSVTSKQYFILFSGINILEHGFPIIVVVVSSALSLFVLVGRQLEQHDRNSTAQSTMKWWEWLLLKQLAVNMRQDQQNGRQQIERIMHRASITVMITAMNFTLLNLPYVAYTSVVTAQLLGWEADPDKYINRTSFKVFAFVICTVLHSIDTPFICLWRMRGLRIFVTEWAAAVNQGWLDGLCRAKRVLVPLRDRYRSWFGQGERGESFQDGARVVAPVVLVNPTVGTAGQIV